jgi:hypothetical protein
MCLRKDFLVFHSLRSCDNLIFRVVDETEKPEVHYEDTVPVDGDNEIDRDRLCVPSYDGYLSFLNNPEIQKHKV